MAAVEEVIEHWPERCECGHVFDVGERVAVCEPGRHQVEELPELAVRVIEHRCEHLRCPDCGVERSGELPAGVAQSAFGSRFQAAVAALTVRNRVSRRDAVELCEELFGARIATGTIDAILARTGEVLEGPYEELLQKVRRSAHLNVDETGWRLKGAQRTLWGAFSEEIAVLRVVQNRHEDQVKDLLMGHEGIVTSDRWWAYNHLPLARRQICWAHLRRDFKAHAEGLAAEKEFGELGLSICERLFWAWECFQHTSDRGELKREIRTLQRELKPALRRFAGKAARYKYVRRMSRNLLRVGRHCGRSPKSRAWSRPTTTPSAPCGALSSTASSRLAVSQRRGSAASSDSSRRRSPAGCNAGRCLATSATCLALTPAAIPSRCSRERRGLNAYQKAPITRAFLHSGGGIRTRDLRVMRSPKGGQVGRDGPCLLRLGRVRWGWICSKRNLEWNPGRWLGTPVRGNSCNHPSDGTPPAQRS